MTTLLHLSCLPWTELSPNRELYSITVQMQASYRLTVAAQRHFRNNGESNIVQLHEMAKDSYNPYNVVVEFVTETGVRKRQRLKRRKKKSASANSGDASLMVGADQDAGIDDGFVSGVEDIDSDLEVATDSEEDVKK